MTNVSIKLFLITITMICWNLPMIAQHSYLSDLDQELLTKRLLKNKQHIVHNTVETRGDQYFFVPVNFSIFQSPIESSQINFNDILEIICNLNFYFEDSKIRFFLKSIPDFKENQAVYEDPLSDKSIVELTKLKDYNALNIFITSNTFLSPDFQNLVAYYTPQHDWIMINEKEILNGNSHFIAHEVGHYFSLLHTFNGWETQPFNTGIHGNKAGFLAPDGITLTEQVNRNNCNNEGDYICDTAPDYNFGYGWIKNGETCHDFDEIVYDPKNQIVDPDESNIMGYFLGCEEYYFSKIQQQIMEIDYMSELREPLRWHNNQEEIKLLDPPILFNPLENERILERDILLEWEAIEGASAYLIQLENNLQNNKVVIEKIITTNSYLLENLDNGNYSWKVKPFNLTSTCNDYSFQRNFSIDNSLSISSVQYNKVQIKLIPNFLGTNSFQSSLYITNNQSVNLNVDLFDVNGRIIEKMYKDELLPGGYNTLLLPFKSDLIPGMYFLKVYSFDFEQTLKLIIQ